MHMFIVDLVPWASVAFLTKIMLFLETLQTELGWV